MIVAMTRCTIEGCESPSRRRKLCNKHSTAFYKFGNPLVNKKFKRTCKVTDCIEYVHGNGLCDKHYSRFQRHGSIDYTLPDSTTRYHNGYNRGTSTECWPWIKGLSRDGYGKFAAIKDGTKKTYVASRYGWELSYGPIPEGYFVCHTCDTPACQNPKHWFLGTPLDNTRDMIAKGRSKYTGRTKDPRTGRFI